jgi:hypothetical protein
MTIQIQQRYAEVQINPAESWNVNLVTIMSKMVLAFVMFAVFMAFSMMG